MLDLCAAPGGKSTELAARLRGTGLLVSNDISRSRAQGLLKNLELFGAGNILVTSETPESLLGNFEGFFDKILVDAPCSGKACSEGTKKCGKKLDGAWAEYYAPIQQEILYSGENAPTGRAAPLFHLHLFSSGKQENLKLLEAEQELEIFPLSTGVVPRGADPRNASDLASRISVEGHFTALLGKKDKPRSTLKRTDGVPPFFPRDSRSLPLFFSARF